MSNKVQYTIRNIPPAIDVKLKAQAKHRGVSLNKLLLMKIGAISSKSSKQPIHRDLDWMWKVVPIEDSRQLAKITSAARELDKQHAQAVYDLEKASE